MSLMLDLVDTRTILVAVSIFFIFVLIIQYMFEGEYSRASSLKTLPPSGPREWPVIGCLPSLIGDEPYKLIAAMSRQYGPVFLTRIGMIRTLILNDYDSMREAFARSGDDFADRPRTGLIEHITKGRGIISAHVGHSQREKRRFGLASLRSLGMGKSRLVENITAEIDSLASVFSRRDGAPFFPFHDITVSVCNIISWITMGKRFRHDDAEFKQFLDIIHEGIEICESTGAVGFIPILEYLPLPVWRRLADNHRKWLTFADAMLEEAIARQRKEEPCFIQMYSDEMRRLEDANGGEEQQAENDTQGGLSTQESNGRTMFDLDDLRQTFGDFFAAGTDTTATTLSWSILYVVLYPDVQRKVHEELDAAVGRDRMPTLEDRKNIPYTEAVLLEIQRVASIVPLGVPHSTPWDAKLYGYDIPAGTFILPNIWAVHHDPSVWKNPEDFVPERFLNEDRSAVVQREELVQFCIGRRKCLGEQLARMELFFFFSHLLHRFEFKLPEGAPRPSTVGRPGATRTPMPYKVCAIPRT